MSLIDTHCHIHEADYPLPTAEVLAKARQFGVTKLICVGTNEVTSAEAVEFASVHGNCWASVGLHPHDAKNGVKGIEKLEGLLAIAGPVAPSTPKNFLTGRPQKDFWELPRGASPAAPASKFVAAGDTREGTAAHRAKASKLGGARVAGPASNEGHDYYQSKVVAIGECGLDYFYNNSPKNAQIDMLHAQIELALVHNLPIIFHVREAFDDFWPIFNQYKGIRGVLHSFTDSLKNLEKALNNDLFIGVNGISTFTKVEAQQQMFAQIPLNKLLLETDSPFLTPAPLRGTVNEPAFIKFVAQKQADLRNTNLQELSAATTKNATTLFNL